MDDRLRVGIITATHGIRGEVKVFPTTDDAGRFSELERVYADMGEVKVPLEIQGVKFFKRYAILKFNGIDNINEAEKYKGKDLLIDRKEAVPLEEDEYYIADLIGLKVYTEDGENLGVLKDVIRTGANDVYVVNSKKHGEILIPAIKECILSVSIEEKRLDIHLMDGLLQEKRR